MVDTFSSQKESIAVILGVDASEVDLNTSLRDSDFWDSFARLSAVALITKHTGKQLSLDDMSKIETVADLVALLSDRRGAK